MLSGIERDGVSVTYFLSLLGAEDKEQKRTKLLSTDINIKGGGIGLKVC